MSQPSERPPRRKFQVSREDEGRALGDYLAARCAEAPVGFLNRLIRQGFVTVDGQPADRRDALTAGSAVALRLPEGAFLVAPNPRVPFSVTHEEDSLVVIEKPSGVVTEPGIGHKLDSLLNGLVARYGAALDEMGPEHDYGMVHRLDRGASGLLVVARNAATQRALRQAFSRRRVEKRYRLLVHGNPVEDKGRIAVPLGRTRRRGRAVPIMGGPGTRPAVTQWRVRERFNDCALVEATPKTGRWHQLRLHFQAIGHPVAGDAEHGDPAADARLRERVGLDRLFLHAAMLAFDHPDGGRRMVFTSDLPADLTSALAVLRDDRNGNVQ